MPAETPAVRNADTTKSGADTPSPWRMLSPDEQLAFAKAVAPDVVVDRELRTIVVSSQCSVCSHEFKQTISAEQLMVDPLRTGERGDGSSWQGVVRFVVSCGCSGDHPGRPPGLDRGCGAAAKLKDIP